ncbi:relaxase domain-containing protein [Methylorubrum populi]|uniref:MobF family relaxase n=1 Tax=Methylorubrum rhodesianum TaxID=29427 RepID=UPI00190D46E5|nr:MobF family relaxase [Methylorubrum rhodesianum]MBK3404229.1 relaxase domain-containing protein [Methylorubrum rhodesianum]MBY0144022.1 relaxase domain-containing protein [Methylorubrum populi]
MTASLQRLRPGSDAATYYLTESQAEARPDRRGAYYQAEGEGTWWSSGESVVRHGAAITGASFRNLCAGLDPGTGRALVRGAGAQHQSGTDCTLTPAKAVSVLWAAGTPEQRAGIEAAHRAAVEQALSFLTREGLLEVRTGAGGVERHRPSDLIVARFDHFTTREGDPNLHTHCVVLNVAGAPRSSTFGRYKSLTHLTIDPARLFEQQRGLGAAYRAALSRELRVRFGLHYRPAGQGQWEVAGVPDALLAAFSKRSAQILERAGLGATSAQREVAALATRRDKAELPTGPELEARWQAELGAAGIDPWQEALRVAQKPDPSRAHEADRAEREAVEPFDPPEIAGDTPVARAASALFRHENVLNRAALLQAALEEASLRGLGIEAVEAELAQLERDGRLMPLSTVALDPSQHACWTSPGIAACEAALLRTAERPGERIWITPEAVAAALAAAPHLSAEQAEAVRQVAGSDGVSILEAGAGTGKTTTAQALVLAATRSKLRVIGLAPSWVAADELAHSAQISVQAIARWRYAFAREQAETRTDPAGARTASLDRDTLVLVDEAGMVSTRDLEAVLSATRQAGAKVVLIGDRRQLASVGGASALRAVSEVVGRAGVLGEVRRQAVDWQRAASMIMGGGDAEAGLRAYAANDRIELISGSEAAQARAIAVWSEARARHGGDVLMLTRRNADAAALNLKARAVLRAEERLGPDLVSLPARDRTDRPAVLALAVGDSLRFGESLPHLSVRNGNRARVESITRDPDGETRLRLRLEDGRVLNEPWRRLAREPRFGGKVPQPKLVHSYAGTVHAAQGRTSAAAVMLVAASTDAREVYVGLTRHRSDARVVVERDRLDALCRQRQADPRLPASDTMVLERLFAEARVYQEKVNVADYAADRIAFMRSGTLGLREQVHGGIDVARAVRAARALRAALAQLKLNRLTVPAWLLLDAEGRRRLARAPTAHTRRLFARIAGLLGRPGPDREHGGLER